MGQHGPWRKGERAALGAARLPPFPSPIRTRRSGAPPLSLSPPWSNPSPTRIGGGNPTPRGSRTLLAHQTWPASPSPLDPLYTGAGGTPKTYKLIYGSFLSRVRCPLPPNSTSIISLKCLGEALRR